jgi:hypothetical protein
MIEMFEFLTAISITAIAVIKILEYINREK